MGGAPGPPGHAGGRAQGPAAGLGVGQGLPALGVGRVLGCPQGGGSNTEARLCPALPAAPSRGIAKRLTWLAFALLAPPPHPSGEPFSFSSGLVMGFLVFFFIC